MKLYTQLAPGNAETTEADATAPLLAILANWSMRLIVAEMAGEVAGTVTLVLVPNLTHGGKP